MMNLMLDTSGYAAFMRGNPQAVELLQKAEVILLPVTVLGELFAGFESGQRTEDNLRGLAAFQASPRVHAVDVTAETAKRYASIYGHLRKAGRPIPTNDLWIAAAAMEHGAILFTADRHFLEIPQILVRHLAGL